MARKDGQQAFTLIEMMATIAVISILSAIVIANYAPARERAHLKDAETTMQTARGAASLCVFRNVTLSAPDPANPVCADSDIRWPDIGALAGGWSYSADADDFEGDVSDRTFLFKAIAPGGDTIITCTETQCTTATI